MSQDALSWGKKRKKGLGLRSIDWLNKVEKICIAKEVDWLPPVSPATGSDDHSFCFPEVLEMDSMERNMRLMDEIDRNAVFHNEPIQIRSQR